MLNALAQALDLSAEVLLDQAGLVRDIRHRDPVPGQSASRRRSSASGGSMSSGSVLAGATLAGATEAAIRDDDRLSTTQKRALLSVYRSYVSVAPSARG